ncbi:TetR/AcrR family transcriptional regulator [Streptomyces pathocidini]|uniref:TetR/AcrR family transcriptional regulator n=1 Tax=Streptomyces pathocidini TaxID=1650571 RepID=UPI0033DE05C3
MQRRSADRLERILDACAEILGETGYEALSTRAVAVRAGVPIGSVYRFFGNKRAMADALAHRNLDVYLGRVSDRLAAADEGERPGEGRGGDGLLDWRWAVDVVLDTYVEMKRDTPGFALLDFSVPGPAPVPPTAPEPAPVPDSPSESATAGTTGGGACAPNRLLAERLCALLAEPLGRTPDEALRRTFLVGAQAADVLVRLAFRTDPAGDPAILAETKTLLRAYLTRTLG